MGLTTLSHTLLMGFIAPKTIHMALLSGTSTSESVFVDCRYSIDAPHVIPVKTYLLTFPVTPFGCLKMKDRSNVMPKYFE